MSWLLRTLIGLGIMFAAGYFYQNHVGDIIAAMEESESSDYDYDDSDYDDGDYAYDDYDSESDW